MKEVVITGLGFVSSIGNSTDDVAAGLRHMRSGIERFEPFIQTKQPVSVLGTIKGYDLSSPDQEDWVFPETVHVSRSTLRGLPPHALYALAAVNEAIGGAGLDEASISNPGTGLYTASGGSMSQTHFHHARLQRVGIERANPKGIVASIAGTLNFNLVAHYRIQGFSAGFVSACASSGHALGFAWEAIQSGQQERMIVVGAEDGDVDCILPFAGMRALSVNPDPASASRPFDRDRDGFVGTGGAAALILESREAAEARGARILARFLGWGQSSDGYNPVLPEPEGLGLARAMELALSRGGLRAGDVQYINAHAPSTPFGDAAELAAIKKVFPRGQRPWVSSTKALTGHGLSMASALEAAITVLSISQDFLPGSAHIQNLDPLAEGVPILRETRDATVSCALSNSSGFGGANVSLLFGRYDA